MRTVARLVVSLLMAALVAEVAVRFLHPTPRRRIVRADKIGGFHVVEGVTLWDDGARRGANAERLAILEDADCDTDGAFRVMLTGDSIFNGMIDLAPEEVASVRLKRALEARWPEERFCVRNLAVSGFSPVQSLTRGAAALDDFAPHVVLMEYFGGPPRPQASLGDRVYNVQGLRLDPTGTPNPAHLPAPINRWLLRRSRFYEYAVLAQPDPRISDEIHDLTWFVPTLDAFAADVASHGGELTVWVPGYLSYPFDAQPPSLALETEPILAWSRAHGFVTVPLWEALAEHDAAALALDDVHLNAAGHALLAEQFEAVVVPRVEAWRASP